MPRRNHKRKPRQQRKRILVVVEGSPGKSEEEYFKQIHSRLPRSTSPSLKVVAAGGEPRRVWDECRNRMNRGDFDFGCLVLDHDDHPTLPEVLCEVSKHKNVAAVVTNPQFELWLLLHAQDQNAAITARVLRQKVREHNLVSPKTIRNCTETFPLRISNKPMPEPKAVNITREMGLPEATLRVVFLGSSICFAAMWVRPAQSSVVYPGNTHIVSGVLQFLLANRC